MLFRQIMFNEGQISHIVGGWRKKFEEWILLVCHCSNLILKRAMPKFHPGAFPVVSYGVRGKVEPHKLTLCVAVVRYFREQRESLIANVFCYIQRV